MEYKFKPIELNVEKVEDIELPTARDRVIEKRGDVVEFSMNDIDNHIHILTKARKEHVGMVEHEDAIIDNIEHFHKFAKNALQNNGIVIFNANCKTTTELMQSFVKA
mgnify:CR=1 FL=1